MQMVFLYSIPQLASTFAMLLLVLCLIISYGVIEAWCGFSKKQKCLKLFAMLRHWLLLPIFVILVILTWIFSTLFIVGSTVASDMCIDSPNQRVEAVLIEYGDFTPGQQDARSIILSFLLYYVQGCPADSVPEDFLNQITDVLEVLQTEISFVEDSLADAGFFGVCGVDPASVLTDSVIDPVQDTVCQLAEALASVQDYFSCDNWRPLYTKVMYDAVCYDGNEGFYYIAVTQFCIVIFAMIMLTLRVAFTEIEVMGEGHDKTNVTDHADGLDAAAAVMADTPPQNENSDGLYAAAAVMANAPAENDVVVNGDGLDAVPAVVTYAPTQPKPAVTYYSVTRRKIPGRTSK